MSIGAMDLEFIVRGWLYIKSTPGVNAYWEKRPCEEKYMDRLLTKGDHYYGEHGYQFWDSGIMEMNLTDHALYRLTEKYEPEALKTLKNKQPEK